MVAEKEQETLRVGTSSQKELVFKKFQKQELKFTCHIYRNITKLSTLSQIIAEFNTKIKQ